GRPVHRARDRRPDRAGPRRRGRAAGRPRARRRAAPPNPGRPLPAAARERGVTMAALTIARLTLQEASRRRLILTIFLLTLVVVAFTGYSFFRLNSLRCGPNNTPCQPTEMKMAAAVLIILVVYMFDSVIAVGAAFVAAPSISTDVESGIAL